MPFAIEDHDGQLIDVALKRLGDLIQILLHRFLETYEVGRSRADDDLVHVDIGCVEEAPFFRGRENGDRIRGAGRAEIRSFQWVNSNVDLRINLTLGPAAAERLADIEHRRFVALADRKSTRLNSSHEWISYAVFCLK